ncbi:2,3-diphosphoglycerate synthetase [Methanosphaera sp. ISO3-F5]|uniref:2,3-diphosphoglycerate synthetase n=1 Tax=Methanosphaera sp. ISO3-F5 TaxID=1452353 RepID=UPI002B262629|nr:2,3-diphosphoglycerate synthetase [Methanosphaera sp. ISO3-F5]WQH65036.1 2,3-diphosphoglycerate synthetase [Methanosphaera sp. ISO3-F5]
MAQNKVLCLVDGEHYFPVTKSAVDKIESKGYDVKLLLFIGGTEKLRDNNVETISEIFNKPVIFGQDHKKIPYDLIEQAIIDYDVDYVFDLSDEPVVNYSKRFKIATVVLQHNVPYKGPDFEFKPLKEYDVLENPSYKILGTGKRIGKTAVSAYTARLINTEDKYDPCIVAMGRGGPEVPEVVHGDEIKLTPQYLMEQSDMGKHAASDHWEDALLSRVLTVGCRRCAGGMVGQVYITNMVDGAKLTNDLNTNLIAIEGSGSAIPPIKTDKNIVLVGANQPIETITEYFGPFRIKLADLIIITMCDEQICSKEKLDNLMEEIKNINPDAEIIPTIFRPYPVESIKNKNVLFATTAPESVQHLLKEYLEDNFDCNVVAISSNLSNRPLLQEDIDKNIDNVDIMLTEIKAAAIDVATKVALNKGLEVVYCDNIPIPINDDYDLDNAIMNIVHRAVNDFNS